MYQIRKVDFHLTNNKKNAKLINIAQREIKSFSRWFFSLTKSNKGKANKKGLKMIKSKCNFNLKNTLYS